MLAICSGGKSPSFFTKQLEDQVFKFSVQSREVGFLVVNQGLVVCDLFKLSFFLFNEIGFSKALIFAKRDSGPSFTWQVVRSKKTKDSQQVYGNSLHILSGANQTPLGNRASQFRENIGSFRIKSSFAEVVKSNPVPLTGANSIPLGSGKQRTPFL